MFGFFSRSYLLAIGASVSSAYATGAVSTWFPFYIALGLAKQPEPDMNIDKYIDIQILINCQINGLFLASPQHSG